MRETGGPGLGRAGQGGRACAWDSMPGVAGTLGPSSMCPLGCRGHGPGGRAVLTSSRYIKGRGQACAWAPRGEGDGGEPGGVGGALSSRWPRRSPARLRWSVAGVGSWACRVAPEAKWVLNSGTLHHGATTHLSPLQSWVRVPGRRPWEVTGGAGAQDNYRRRGHRPKCEARQEGAAPGTPGCHSGDSSGTSAGPIACKQIG